MGEVNGNEKLRVSDVVRESIQNMILNDLQPKDRLPTEAELTKMFSASRSSVREAIQALETLGMVERRNGGTYVTGDLERRFVDPLCIMVQMNVAKMADVIGVRRILETEAARMAAQYAKKSHISALEDTVWLMQKPTITIEQYIELDVQFHLLVAEAAGNSVLYQFIHDTNVVVSRFFPSFCTLKIAKETAIPLQIRMVDAIKDKNAEEAGQCMALHLDETRGKFDS